MRWVACAAVLALVPGVATAVSASAVTPKVVAKGKPVIVSPTPPKLVRPTSAVDVTPPAVPAGLTTTVVDRQVTVKWKPVVAADLAGYRIYRSTTTPVATDAAHALGGGLLQTTASYIDVPKATGDTYFYVVKAFDKTGNGSAASAPVAAVSVDLTPPPAPTGLRGTYDPVAGTVTLTWDSKAEGDTQTVGYKIFFCGTGTGGLCFTRNDPLITTTTWTTPVTTPMTGAEPFRYRVAASDAHHNLASSTDVLVPTTGE